MCEAATLPEVAANRKEAIRLGLKKYYGKPCKNCFSVIRSLVSARCINKRCRNIPKITRLIDRIEIGIKFGRLTIVSEPFFKMVGKNKSIKRPYIKTKCECGNMRDNSISDILSGKVISCGCYSKEIHRQRQINKTYTPIGTKFNRLTTISEPFLVSNNKGRSRSYVKVQCICGTAPFDVALNQLRQQRTQSCGCLMTKYTNKECSLTFVNRCRANAKLRDINFELTQDDIQNLYDKQSGRCALSGVPIFFTANHSSYSSNTTASLDRIDSHKAYTADNIQLIHKALQDMKMDKSQEELKHWCRLIVAKDEGKEINKELLVSFDELQGANSVSTHPTI